MRRPDRLRTSAAVAAAAAIGSALLLPAVASGAPSYPPGPPPVVAEGAPEPGADVGSVPPLVWGPCPEGYAPVLQCSTFEVPLDHDRPEAGTASLAVSRRPATGPGPRTGTLFLNPGGPGAPGSTRAAEPVLAGLAERFDIVGFDPRGVGRSTPAISCPAEADLVATFDAARARPDRADGPREALDAGRRFADSCRGAAPELLEVLGTEFAARDLDLLRAAAGEEQLTYIGFSYGTHLGSVYADLFPSRVRALALDGALDPFEYGDRFTDLLRRNHRASERALDRFLRWCTEQREACAGFGGDDPRAAFDALVDRLDAAPLVVDGPDGPRTANGYTVVYRTYTTLSAGRRGWPRLAGELAQLEAGRAAVTNADLLVGAPPASAHIAIQCTDAAGGVTEEDFLRLAERSRDRSPVFGAALTSGPPSYDGANGAVCAQWPVRDARSDWRGDFRAQGAAPVLVVGSTGDPSTPYSGAVALAATLDDAALLTLVGEGHTSYRVDACIRRAVDAYLVDLVVPGPGTDRCVEDPTGRP